MKRRTLALALTAAMVAGVTGCGNSAAEDTTAAAEEVTTAAATEADAAETATDSADTNSAVQTLVDNTTGSVDLTVWAGESDAYQTVMQTLIDEFVAQYPSVEFNITLGAQSESQAKDTVLADPEAAADVFAFADDQLNELVNANALQEVAATYTYDVAAENSEGAVEAASKDGKLYAYPMTASNGYFMFYDASVFSEDDVKSLDKMVEVAQAADKKIAINFSNAWYLAGFFMGNGLDATLADDGVSTECNWNAAGGTDVAQAILDLVATGVVVDMDDATTVTGIEDGTVAAAINGTWNATVAEGAWGENYSAAKLPTMNIAGTDTQISSYRGYKLIGVNAYSKNVGWSMLLAEYLTSEDSQVAIFNAVKEGPANINAQASDAVQSDPAQAAFAAQLPYGQLQRVGANFWDPANTIGKILSSGNPDGTDLQELLDTAVEGITAPVE